MNACVRWAAHWVAGDFANGKLYTLDWGMPWEHGQVIERRRVNGVLHDHQNRMTVDAVELVFGTDALGGYKGPGDLTPHNRQGLRSAATHQMR